MGGTISPSREPLRPPRGGKMKTGSIFLVDDDEAMLTMLSEFLSTLGYAVEEFRSAEDALHRYSALGTESVLAVISDVHMPTMDGLEFLKHIKAHPKPKPVILISAFGSLELEKKAINNGADGFVNKPFALNRLKLALESVLAKAS
jgi:DNA-binding NtrC family response regulator